MISECVAPFLEHGEARDHLIVLVHAYSGAKDRLACVRKAIRYITKNDIGVNADIYTPELPFQKKRVCTDEAESIVAGLVDDIDVLVNDRLQNGGGYGTITLVGHSFGAVLARKIAIVAFGEQKDGKSYRPAPFEAKLERFRPARSWAGSIKRIVLLAGMNRGWSASSAMDWKTTVWFGVLQLIGETLYGGRPTLLQIRKGAPFLVQTRLQWLALMDPKYGQRHKIVTVQLLGTGDDLVSPDDNVDYSVDLFGGDDRYFYVEVAHSNHGNIVKMGKEGPSETQTERDERRDKFCFALAAEPEELAPPASIPREQMADNLPPEPDDGVTDLVFVMHGIRDKGFWTQKIARTIKKVVTEQTAAGSESAPIEKTKQAASGQESGSEGKKRKFESWTESYGYFAMLPFVFHTVRQRKVEWLMDRYAEARARYPRATFHYVGHSNGTYLAARALECYPAARFERIVFAGSVVRRDYKWHMRMKPEFNDDRPQVVSVLNYVATRDWVVALFPKGLQPWRRFNLGSAGHDGFNEASKTGPVYNAEYIVGSHGAGHEEPHWKDIAQFIVSGKPPKHQAPAWSEDQSTFCRYLGFASWLLFPLVVAVILAFGIVLFAFDLLATSVRVVALHA